MKTCPFVALLTTARAIHGQQIYIDTTGPTPRPQCTATLTVQPSFTFRHFSLTLSDTVRTATSIPSPTTTATYTAAYSDLSTCFSISATVVGAHIIQIRVSHPLTHPTRMAKRPGLPFGFLLTLPTAPRLGSTALQSLLRQYRRVNWFYLHVTILDLRIATAFPKASCLVWPVPPRR